MSRFINPVPQFWLNDGTLASSGKMKFFENGDYSTLKNTYSQSDNTMPNTNPVSLDGQGRMPPCFGVGAYSVKFYAYDADAIDGVGSLQWTRDDVLLSELTGQFSEWTGLVTYNAGEIVQGSDSEYYRSIENENLGNDPTSAATFWEQIVFITIYNANRTYQINDNVSLAGLLYRANTADLLGNSPPSAQWDNLTFNGIVAGNLTVSGIITGASYVGGNLSKTTDAGINNVYKKTSTTSRSITTTLAADPDLVFTSAASTYYAVKAFINWNGNGSATNGIKIRVGASSGVIDPQIFIANTNTSAANLAPTANQISGVPAGFNKLPNTAGANEIIVIDAVVQTISAGTIYIEWAQSVSEATSTRVLSGSYLIVTKL